jgi:hypothetical protein
LEGIFGRGGLRHLLDPEGIEEGNKRFQRVGIIVDYQNGRYGAHELGRSTCAYNARGRHFQPAVFSKHG